MFRFIPSESKILSMLLGPMHKAPVSDKPMEVTYRFDISEPLAAKLLLGLQTRVPIATIYELLELGRQMIKASFREWSDVANVVVTENSQSSRYILESRPFLVAMCFDFVGGFVSRINTEEVNKVMVLKAPGWSPLVAPSKALY